MSGNRQYLNVFMGGKARFMVGEMLKRLDCEFARISVNQTAVEVNTAVTSENGLIKVGFRNFNLELTLAIKLFSSM